jgi:NAD(P)-dependent dehydrogenase (short-subunit alcohol dehydrogenase family)
MELNGAVAVITGGASGIGRGIGLAFADAGTHVVVADVDLEAAERIAAEIADRGVRSLAVRTDVARAEAVEALADVAYQAFGVVNVLCNNAGVGAMGLLDEVSEGDWHWVLSVNVGGIYHGVRAFVPRMKAQGAPAHIVNTASEHGLGVPSGQLAAYTASKHAVLGLSDVMRRYYAGSIGVSVLCPGMVATQIWNAARNRPEEHGGAVHLPARVGRLWQRQGMDPLAVGQRVVEGVRRGDFFILTHPEVRTLVEQRYRELLDAFDALAAADRRREMGDGSA